MNIAQIEKFFSCFNQWTQRRHHLRWGLIFLLILGCCWGNSQSAKAEIFHSQVNPIFPSESLLMSQSSLPKSVETAIRQDLSRRTRLQENQFKIKQFSRQTWPDGCLGLASGDELCTMALVDGWRVVMTYQDKTWVYRTDETGMAIRREKQ